MKKLVLVGGNFSGSEVSDEGDTFSQSWCEQNGVKAECAFFGVSRCFSDIYQKTQVKDSDDYYLFIKTIG